MSRLLPNLARHTSKKGNTVLNFRSFLDEIGRLYACLEPKIKNAKLLWACVRLTFIAFLGYKFAGAWVIAKAEGTLPGFYTYFMLDEYFDAEEWLTEGFMAAVLFMFLVPAIGSFKFHQRPERVERINKKIKLTKFFISLPHKLFATLFAFTLGFTYYASKVHSPATLPLLLSACLYLGLPWSVFRYYADNLSFSDTKLLRICALPMSIILGALCLLIAAYLATQGYLSIFETYDWAKSFYIERM